MNAVVIFFVLLCETWIHGCQSEIIVGDIDAILFRLETFEKEVKSLVQEVKSNEEKVESLEEKVKSLEKKVESLEGENKQLRDALEKYTNIPNSDNFKPEQISPKVTNRNEATNHKTQNNVEKRLLLGTPESATSGVAFRAYLSKYIDQLGSHQIVEYNEVPLNIGNAYDSRHGHFTAPVKGLYIIWASAFALPGEEAVLSLVHNGNQIDVLHADGRPAHYGSMTKVNPLMMNQGDMVWLMTHPGYEGKRLYGYPLIEHNMFGGVLLLAL